MAVTVLQARHRKKAAKEYAITHGIALPKGFAWQPGRIGKPARDLVRAIQRHVWPKQAPTGLFDTRTIELLFPVTSPGPRALKVAETKLGVKEDPAGSNTGPEVRVFQHVTNPGQTGFPWCASFVTWALRSAGWKVYFPNQSYVPAWVAAAHSGKLPLYAIGRGDVREGDIVCYDWNNDRIADHIGFIKTVPDANGDFTAVEGNTAVGNDSNGGEVMVRERHASDVACFIRLK